MKLPTSIVKEYEKGDSCETIAIRHGTYTYAVRTALHNFNAKMRPPGAMSRGKTRRNQKLSELDVSNILKLDDMDVSHSDIGRKFDISRERVRQICAEAGHSSKRSRIILKYTIIHEQRVARKLQKQQRIEEISKAWKSGMSIHDLGQMMKEFGLFSRLEKAKIRKIYVSSKISLFRNQYGTKMFPYRRPWHWNLQPLEYRAQRILDIAREWNASGDVRKIQKLFGYANYGSAHAAICHIRSKRPGLLLTKKQILNNTINKLNK